MSVRVALLGPSRHPVAEPFAGGQEAHVATLSRALREHGCHVVLHAAPGSDPGLADELVVHPELPDLSPVARLDPHLPEPRFLCDQHAFLSVLRDLLTRSDIDVVHNSSLHHLPLVASSAVDRPLVTTLHTPPFPWMELGVSLADPRSRFVAVSADLASRWTVLREEPRVIYNGVDPSAFRLGPGGGDLVWLGRLVREKGADLAVLAARAAARPLRIIGPISDRDWFDAVLSPLLGDQVTYEGHLDHDTAARAVGESGALLVTPRWDEPFGLVAVEAALTGTPVVAIGRGGLPEVVDAAMGVVVEPEPDGVALVRSLAVAVERALSLPREDVRATASSRFGAGRMAADYMGLYREAIDAW